MPYHMFHATVRSTIRDLARHLEYRDTYRSPQEQEVLSDTDVRDRAAYFHDCAMVSHFATLLRVFFRSACRETPYINGMQAARFIYRADAIVDTVVNQPYQWRMLESLPNMLAPSTLLKIRG